MTQHIGIVGCSAEGASLCYQTIFREGTQALGGHTHPEISMHTPSLHLYVDCLDRGDIEGVADLMLASAEKLAQSGADLLICPDNTIHQAMPLVRPRSPLPWLHIAEIVAEESARGGFAKVGILGTHWLTGSDVYSDALSQHNIAALPAAGQQREDVGRIIMEELVFGRSEPASIARLYGVVEEMRAEGCDAVVLGCTELPLVMDDAGSCLPTLDSTRLLARAALKRAIAQ